MFLGFKDFVFVGFFIGCWSLDIGVWVVMIVFWRRMLSGFWRLVEMFIIYWWLWVSGSRIVVLIVELWRVFGGMRVWVVSFLSVVLCCWGFLWCSYGLIRWCWCWWWVSVLVFVWVVGIMFWGVGWGVVYIDEDFKIDVRVCLVGFVCLCFVVFGCRSGRGDWRILLLMWIWLNVRCWGWSVFLNLRK